MANPEKQTILSRSIARVVVPAVGFILVVAVVMALYDTHSLPAIANRTHGPQPPASERAGTNLIDVQILKPIRRDVLHSITLPANVAPLYQTTIYAKVSGYLKWIGPDKGDLAKKDEVLAIIDAPEVEEQYRQAVADYKIKRLTYERLANVWRQTPDVIAKQDVDVAEAAFEGAKHLMEQRTVLRDYMKVRAPFSGIITARFADPGALIQTATSSSQGAIPLFTMMSIDVVRVYTNVPQDDIHLVKAGTPAVLKIKDLADHPFKGTVTRTTMALDPSTRTMLTEIDLPNSDHLLQPGMFGEVTLELRLVPQALVVPAGAVVSVGKAESVFVIDQGHAKRTAVRTGLNDGRWVQVLEGLAGSEEVVVVGQGKLNDGSLVRPNPYRLPEGAPAIQQIDIRKS